MEKKYENMSQGQGSRSKNPNFFEHYRYSNQTPTISDQKFLTCMLPLFRCRGLDLGLTTLKLNCGLDILKMYLHAKNEVAR